MNKRHTLTRTLQAAVIFISLLGFTTTAHALIIGSNNVVSRQTNVVFPSGSNTVLGFAWMTSGFTLQDSATTVSWDSIFPISGNILLNGGTLQLLSNLTLFPDAQILGSGTINAGGKTMFLGGDWTVGGSIAFPTSGVIDGGGHTVTLSGSGSLSIAAGQTLRLKNINIFGLAAGKLTIASTGVLTLENVDLNLDSAFGLSAGTIEAAGSVVVRSAGGAAFTVSSAGTFRVKSHGICRFDLESVLNYSAASNDKLVFEDATARLVLDGATLLVTQNVQLLKGQLVFQKKAAVQISTGRSLEIGDGSAVSNNIDLFNAPDASVTSSGIITNHNI